MMNHPVRLTGGGFRVEEITPESGRYLNMTITVLEEHLTAFELRVYGQGDDNEAAPPFRRSRCS